MTLITHWCSLHGKRFHVSSSRKSKKKNKNLIGNVYFEGYHDVIDG